MRPFIRQEDAHLRLHDTVCMYKGSPVYVEVILDWQVNHVHVLPLRDAISKNSKKIVVDISSDDFSALIPELGYINYKKDCSFLKRVSGRVQKQGLSIRCVVYPNTSHLNDYPYASWFCSPDMENVLKNVYPSQDEAFHAVWTDACTSRAFHKHIAFSKKKGVINLEYRGRVVGYFSPERERLLLNENIKDRSFLEQILNKNGVLV